ncbi:MAG: ubiquinol-cytochrome C reductase, partial [Nocardioidaceae bacterium]
MTEHTELTAAKPAEADPIPDPGLHEHTPRPTDIDEHAAKRAERQVATMFGLSSIFAILFVVAYFVFDIGDNPTVIWGWGMSNLARGVPLGLALLLIGLGAIQWARKLMSDVEIVEPRHPVASHEDDPAEARAPPPRGGRAAGGGRRAPVPHTPPRP